MTSFRQFEANRRNALKSTGPKTQAGKERSRSNALRHGLTAETVIGLLENIEEYRAFEEAIAADYDAQSAIERELVLRLASLLWRLRRATAMETGLFVMEAELVRHNEQELTATSREVIQLMFRKAEVANLSAEPSYAAEHDSGEDSRREGPSARLRKNELAHCFLGLANLPTYPLDRLSRYEATLWRQVGRILFALDTLDRRKPQERWRGISFDRAEVE